MIHVVDCLEFMRDTPDNDFDMVFTSPPFKDEDVNGDYWTVYDNWMREMMRVAGKVVIVIHSATKLNNLIANYPPKRTLIWGKGISQMSYRWNPILVYQISDDYKVNSHIYSDAFGIESVVGKWKVHKYQDPEILYEAVIKMFKGCETVFDPFAGSGTTERVCKKLKKGFTGCEIDPERFRIETRNLAQQEMFQ